MVALWTGFRIGFAVWLALLLGGCRPLATPLGPEATPDSTPTLSPVPTQTAVPAPDFTPGRVDLPQGFVLLLSHPTWRVCSNPCDCPAVEGLRRGYDVRVGTLSLHRGGMDRSWDEGALPSIVYAHGDFEEALVVVEALPFAADGDFPILAAFEDGTIVFEWDGHAYQLATGEAWQITRSTDYGGGCVITGFSALRNLGLWPAEKVEVE